MAIVYKILIKHLILMSVFAMFVFAADLHSQVVAKTFKTKTYSEVQQITPKKNLIYSFNKDSKIIKRNNALVIKQPDNSILDVLKANFYSRAKQNPASGKSSQRSLLNIISSINNSSIVSSFNNNIKVRAFENGYTFVNFTPSMHIQPTDFISINASHNICMYTPTNRIKESVKPLIIECAAVLAIDHYVKKLPTENNSIKSIIGFAVKNFILELANRIFNGSAVLNRELNYYYSINIGL